MNFENKLRKIKRKSFSRGYYSEEKEEFIPSEFFSFAAYVDHVPMKKENKKLRNIMSKTSLKKEEVLSIKKYRQELSKEQNKQGTLHSDDRRFVRKCKQFMKDTSTSIFDKKFNEKFLKYIDNDGIRLFSIFNYYPRHVDYAAYYLKIRKIQKNK